MEVEFGDCLPGGGGPREAGASCGCIESLLGGFLPKGFPPGTKLPKGFVGPEPKFDGLGGAFAEALGSSEAKGADFMAVGGFATLWPGPGGGGGGGMLVLGPGGQSASTFWREGKGGGAGPWPGELDWPEPFTNPGRSFGSFATLGDNGAVRDGIGGGP